MKKFAKKVAQGGPALIPNWMKPYITEWFVLFSLICNQLGTLWASAYASIELKFSLQDLCWQLVFFFNLWNFSLPGSSELSWVHKFVATCTRIKLEVSHLFNLDERPFELKRYELFKCRYFLSKFALNPETNLLVCLIIDEDKYKILGLTKLVEVYLLFYQTVILA